MNNNNNNKKKRNSVFIIMMQLDVAPNPNAGQNTASIDLQAQAIQTGPSCDFQAIHIASDEYVTWVTKSM